MRRSAVHSSACIKAGALTLLALLLSVLPLSAERTTPFSFDADGRCSCSCTISFGRGEFSGICAMRSEGDDLRGTVVNHFGVKAFDFVSPSATDKVQVLNPISMLRRRAVRRVIAADLRYLLTHDSGSDAHHVLTAGSDGTVQLVNTRRSITYTFTPLSK